MIYVGICSGEITDGAAMV